MILTGLCGGALVSPRVVLTAFHCTHHPADKERKPCDHSDEQRLAVLGRHEFEMHKLREYTTIPIIKVLTPENGGLTVGHKNSHDFALLILKEPAKYTPAIGPICLPEPNAEFGGKKATAAGWGRTDKPSVSRTQSPVLKKVELTVSNKSYWHHNMFGTVVSKKDNLYQDPCSGDSGGI